MSFLPTPRVLPVVHHDTAALTLEQAELAIALGADGVFLIAHASPDEDLVPLAQELQRAHPHHRIGVNFLSLSAVDALTLCKAHGIRLLWVDAPEISSAGMTPQGQSLSDRAKAAGIEVFASVAFKYQPHEPDAALAARRVTEAGMLPTTSGTGTGSPPTVAKIRSMREAIGPAPRLAIASGMDPANVGDYLPFATDLLVATGVSLDAHRFDPGKLVQFIRQVHG